MMIGCDTVSLERLVFCTQYYTSGTGTLKTYPWGRSYPRPADGQHLVSNFACEVCGKGQW